MASEYIYRENVPVYIDGIDFGFTCTLVRDHDINYHGISDEYGLITFTYEQALVVASMVNTHNDYDDPNDDYLQGRLVFDPTSDIWTEYSDNEGTHVYDRQVGFDVEDGTHLYAIGSDWSWSLEKSEE